jgi:hypothetical protein
MKRNANKGADTMTTNNDRIARIAELNADMNRASAELSLMNLESYELERQGRQHSPEALRIAAERKAAGAYMLNCYRALRDLNN